MVQVKGVPSKCKRYPSRAGVIQYSVVGNTGEVRVMT